MIALTRILAIVLIGTLAACSGGGNQVQAIYTLNALGEVPAAGGTSAQLLVPEPRALESLSTSKIPVKPTASTLSYYPAVALEDAAPRVIQRVLLDSFQNTGRVKAVGLPGQSLLINYQVVTEVRAFQAETYGVDSARVELSAKILNDSNGQVVADRIFTSVVPISGDGPDAAAEGLNRATQAMAADMVAWTLSVI